MDLVRYTSKSKGKRIMQKGSNRF